MSASSSTLSVLAPKQITPAMLASSTVAQPAASGEALWLASTNYAVGAVVSRNTTNKIYVCLVAGVDATLPENAVSGVAAVPRWIEKDATNRWLMFDSRVSTQTVTTSPMTVVLRPSFFNAIAMFGIDATSVSVVVKDAPGGNVIYTYSGALEGSAPGDYYDYFFAEYKPQTDLVLSGIDQYHNAELTVTLTSGGVIKCGLLAVGDLRPLGSTLYGAKAKPKTYSYIKVDEFGENKIVKRKSAKDMSLSAFVDIAEANNVLYTVTELLDVPCLWIGTNLPQYSGLRVFGLGSGELSYDHAKNCILSINVQGLI
jgi:hypothetical protein